MSRDAFIPAESLHRIIPVVSPASGDSSSGAVRNLHVGGGVNHRMLVRSGTGYSVHPDYAAKGYVLLEDLYAAEDNMSGWALYRRYLDVMQGKIKGATTTVSFALSKLPKEVARRRATQVSEEFDDLFGEPDEPGPSSARPGGQRKRDKVRTVEGVEAPIVEGAGK